MSSSITLPLVWTPELGGDMRLRVGPFDGGIVFHAGPGWRAYGSDLSDIMMLERHPTKEAAMAALESELLKFAAKESDT